MTGPAGSVLILIVETFIGLYLFAVILRFLLQLVRADFYNPVSQLLVKVTNPPLKPLRRVIPGIAGMDLASIVLALLIQALGITLLLLIQGTLYPVPYILMWSGVKLLKLVYYIYFFGLLITVIASWIAPHNYNPALDLLRQVLEPLMSPIRRIMPDLGGIDLSPILAFLLLQIFDILVITPLEVYTKYNALF